MLSNCPPIKDFCDLDISRMPMLIERCRVIAREMVAERAINSRNYMGTSDDQRMVESFGEFFGPIFIGTGDVTSGDRVTDLELIRWRTTLLGANGQHESRKKQLARERVAASRAPATSQGQNGQTATEVDGAAVSVTYPAAATAPARKGKRCSNIDCHDHYYAATCKLIWTKCGKGCLNCEEGKGGSVHVQYVQKRRAS
jgi:hypothetical protein